MNPYRKAATLLVRLIALGLMLVPLILFGLDYFARKTQHTTPSTFATFLKVGSALLGVILLFASGAIARRLTRDFDE
jgi:hypothetical protein